MLNLFSKLIGLGDYFDHEKSLMVNLIYNIYYSKIRNPCYNSKL